MPDLPISSPIVEGRDSYDSYNQKKGTNLHLAETSLGAERRASKGSRFAQAEGLVVAVQVAGGEKEVVVSIDQSYQ